MNKYFFLLVFLILNNCSFDNRSGIWTKEKKVEFEKKTQKLFDEKLLNENELNKNLIIKISNSTPKNNIVSGNNFGILDIKLKFNKISKYKFSKIKYFDQFEPELIFFKRFNIF